MKNEQEFAIIFKYQNVLIPQREVTLKKFKDITYS